MADETGATWYQRAMATAGGVTTLYVDVDGTLVGPGGDLLHGGSTRVVEALTTARRAGLAIVPISGRGRVQVRELCRLLGLPRGIAEIGCLHLEGGSVRRELGAYPGHDARPAEAMRRQGALDALSGCGLEPHDPWNEGREATLILRGRAAQVGAAVANGDVAAALARRSLDWCALVDNGSLARDPDLHAYHLAPQRTGKAEGVRSDRSSHRLTIAETAYVGDSSADAACAPEVGRLWLVANADATLVGIGRTQGSYGDGVAEVIRLVLQGP